MSSPASAVASRQRAARAVLSLGFRPFYLLAGLFAIMALPFWLGAWLGLVVPGGYLHGLAWHSHEMVFGFATAVMAGFLLTAVRNWTGLPTPTGRALAALASLWVLGRVLALTGPASLAVSADVAFLPVLGLVLAWPIWRSRNVRNFKILVVLASLAVFNLVFHLANLAVVPGGLARLALAAALDVITILMAIVGGRVIPAFTANAVAAARPRQVVAVEFAAVGSLVLILAAELGQAWQPLPSSAWIAMLLVAAIAHAIRLLLWDPHLTRRNPLLWMLPLAYAWIPVTLALRASAQVLSVSPTAPVHALTLGAMSGLMLAMMMRSALGHTGRPLVAGPAEIVAFLLVQAAALVRVFATMLWPQAYQALVVLSGLLWSLGFIVFVARYWTILTRPRIDGRATA